MVEIWLTRWVINLAMGILYLNIAFSKTTIFNFEVPLQYIGL